MNSKYQSEYQRSFGREELGCKTGAHSGDLDDAISDNRNVSQFTHPGVSDHYHTVHQHTDSGSLKQPAGQQQQIGAGPDVMYHYQPASGHPSQKELSKQSEYNSKFKPFEEYVYVENEGRYAANGNLAQMNGHKACSNEYEERNRMASKYRARSENGDTPTYPDNPWDGLPQNEEGIDNLVGIANATRMNVADNMQERKDVAMAKPTGRSSQIHKWQQ